MVRQQQRTVHINCNQFNSHEIPGKMSPGHANAIPLKTATEEGENEDRIETRNSSLGRRNARIVARGTLSGQHIPQPRPASRHRGPEDELRYRCSPLSGRFLR